MSQESSNFPLKKDKSPQRQSSRSPSEAYKSSESKTNNPKSPVEPKKSLIRKKPTQRKTAQINRHLKDQRTEKDKLNEKNLKPSERKKSPREENILQKTFSSDNSMHKNAPEPKVRYQLRPPQRSKTKTRDVVLTQNGKRQKWLRAKSSRPHRQKKGRERRNHLDQSPKPRSVLFANVLKMSSRFCGTKRQKKNERTG